jgi:hypothetical protein
MKIKKNIATSDTGFIFNPSTGDSFSANPVAAEIIILLKEGKSPKSVKENILDRYEVDATSLEKDFDDLIGQLRDSNLLDL